MGQNNFPDLHRTIAARAHLYWEEEGRPEGREMAHWERAARDVRRCYDDTPPDDQAPGGIPNDTGASGKLG